MVSGDQGGGNQDSRISEGEIGQGGTELFDGGRIEILNFGEIEAVE